MKKFLTLTAMLLLAAVPADAGDYGKCEASTQECLDHMAAKMQGSGWVGVELDEVENSDAKEVTKVVSGSPAEEAGLEAGDLLLAINGVDFSEANKEKLGAMWKSVKPGDEVTWTMSRNDYDRKVTITLGRMPADLLARYIGQHMLEHAAVEMASADVQDGEHEE